MVYLYHPYPVLPESPPRLRERSPRREQKGEPQTGHPPSPPAQREWNPQSDEQRKRRRVTTEGTIALLLPSLAGVVDGAASQWGAGEVPEGQRLGRGWWDGDVEDVGDQGDGENLGKDTQKEEGEVEDGEIPEPSSPIPKPSKGKERAIPDDEDDDLDIPILKREHYAPRVLHLAKRMAARRGVRVCVDPRAGRELEPTTTTTTTTNRQPKPEIQPASPMTPLPPTPLPPHPLKPSASPAPIPILGIPPPETREATPSSVSDATTTTNHLPLGKGIRGRARGRGTGRWAGHWAAKAAKGGAAAASGNGTAGASAAGRVVSGSLGQTEEKEQGPEAEKRRRRDVGVSLGNSSWWNHLLIEARKARGPQWDDNTEMYQVDRGSALYYQSTRSPPKTPIELPPVVRPPPPAPLLQTSPRIQTQTRPTSSGRGSMAPPPVPVVYPTPPINANATLPAQSPITRGSVPPVMQSPARRVSPSPMLMTRPSPASFANGLPVPERGSVPPQMDVPLMSGMQGMPGQAEGQQTEEMLMQARLQQQHILQRQVLAAQQAQQVQGIVRQGMPNPNQGGNGQGMGAQGLGMPGNLNPAQTAYLRQQGMTPQQMVALNMFAAQQRAQQAAQQNSASSPSLNQPPAQSQNQPLGNRLPPHLMGQFAAQGFPNASGGAAGGGMSNEQARAIMQMQTALYQQRLQQSQGQGSGPGQGAQGPGQGQGQNQQGGH